MARSIGNERVLDAVSETFADISAWDLDGTAPVESSPEQRYVEGDLLGRGGLGEVVTAFDQDLRRSVALKRPRHDKLDARHVAALVKEAQVTAQLEHPNIPPVHTLGFDSDGRPYFTMARLSGRTLADLLVLPGGNPDNCPVELAHIWLHDLQGPKAHQARRLRVGLQIAYALAFAHHRGVLHRDLKPSNIMIGDFGEVHLVDWGIARLLNRPDEDPEGDALPKVTTTVDTHTTVGSFVGTVHYASPEQLQGQRDLDVRSDVYSLGAVLYAMFAGRPPVEGTDLQAVRDKVLAGDVPRLDEVVDVGPRLAAIVHKAIERDRDDRYPDVLALIQDLEALLDGRRISAVQDNAMLRLGRFYLVPRNLRLIDVEMVFWSAVMFGAMVGLLTAPWLMSWRFELSAVLLVGSLALFGPFVWKVWRGSGQEAEVEGVKAMARGDTATTNPTLD